jgi:hypothetical protein
METTGKAFISFFRDGAGIRALESNVFPEQKYDLHIARKVFTV